MLGRSRLSLTVALTGVLLAGCGESTGPSADGPDPDGAGSASSTTAAPVASESWCEDGASGGAVVKSFESGDFTGWIEELAGQHSGRVVTEPVRCGQHAARFELRPGEEAGPVGGYRAELHELAEFTAPMGSEVWYAFSTFVPEDWTDVEDPVVISQWHATPDLADGEVWRSPPVAIRYSGAELRVTGLTSSESVQTDNDGIDVDLYEHEGEFTKGVWHDWVFRVLWSPDEAGIVDAWLDGEEVIDYRGPIGYTDEVGVWFKWGLYRGHDDHPETLSIVHDEYRRGSTCEDVAPGVCGT